MKSNRRLPRVGRSIPLLEDRITPGVILTVTNTDDYDPDPANFDGTPIPGSMRYEVTQAMSDYDPMTTVFDTITFDTSLAGQTIELYHGSLVIDHPVEIDGPKTQFPASSYTSSTSIGSIGATIIRWEQLVMEAIGPRYKSTSTKAATDFIRPTGL